MHRYFCALLFIIFLFSSSDIFALAGKPQTVVDVRLYHQAKTTADIDIFVFNNISTNKDYDYFSLVIPELITDQIELNDKITISSNNIKATPVGYDRAYNYKILNYTNTEYSGNYNGEDFTVITNERQTVVTNTITKKENVNIIDVYSSPLTISSNETLYMYDGQPVILADNNDFVRDINIGNNFSVYTNSSNIEEYVFTRNADIAIFGTIDSRRNTVIITAYIAEINARSLSSYSIEINEFEIEQMLPLFCMEIANQMNAIDKTGTISIATNPADAFLYIDGVYITKTQNRVFIPSLTVGNHRITIKKDDYMPVDSVFTFDKPGESLMLDFNLSPNPILGTKLPSITSI